MEKGIQGNGQPKEESSVADVMERKEILLKEIDLLQNRIEKVEKTSFTIKGWTITLVTAVLALLPESIDKLVIGLVVASATLAFWYLDAFYLKVDKSYRFKYNWVVKNRMNNNKYCFELFPYNEETFFDPDDPKRNTVPGIHSLMLSKTLIVFYAPIIVLAVLYVVFK